MADLKLEKLNFGLIIKEISKIR